MPPLFPKLDINPQRLNQSSSSRHGVVRGVTQKATPGSLETTPIRRQGVLLLEEVADDMGLTAVESRLNRTKA